MQSKNEAKIAAWEATMTNDVRKDLEKYLQENPQIAKLLQTMQKSQADYIRMLTLLGVRQVVTEAPPASTAEGKMNADVSGANQ
ncbi:MAG: hypothetical protein HYV01_13185 [Deltaproteobacteria bacterium]|nr:hypothetical protein [Deltaproteobacteria bacterium]